MIFRFDLFILPGWGLPTVNLTDECAILASSLTNVPCFVECWPQHLISQFCDNTDLNFPSLFWHTLVKMKCVSFS